jgi:hypothetical protein
LEFREAKAIINDFLRRQEIQCPMPSEDGRTYFWSYEVPNSRCLGWICVEETELRITASVTIGELKRPIRSATLIQILELNSYFSDGLSFATEVESLVTIRFATDLQNLTIVALNNQLYQLLCESNKQAIRFHSELKPVGWMRKDNAA